MTIKNDDFDGGATRYLINAIIDKKNNTNGGYTDSAASEIKEVNGRIFRSISTHPIFDYIEQSINIELCINFGDGYKIYKGHAKQLYYSYVYYVENFGEVGRYCKNGTIESDIPVYWDYPKEQQSEIKEINGYTFYPPTTPPNMEAAISIDANGIKKDILIYADFGEGYTVKDGYISIVDNSPLCYHVGDTIIGVYYRGTKQVIKNQDFYWAYPRQPEAAPVSNDKKTILELKLQVIHLEEQVARLRQNLAHELDITSALTSKLENTVNIGDLVDLLNKYEWFTSQLDKKGLMIKIESLLKSHRSKCERITVKQDYINILRNNTKSILQYLADEGYPADPDGGLSELERVIKLIINQDKGENWHGGVPKDALIAQYEHEARQAAAKYESIIKERNAMIKKIGSDLLKTLDETENINQLKDFIHDLNGFKID